MPPGTRFADGACQEERMEAETERLQPPTGLAPQPQGTASARGTAARTTPAADAHQRLATTAAERPLRLGVVSGLGYRNVKGSLEKTSALLRTADRVEHHVVESPEDVAQTLDAYEEKGMDIVAVSGGDGTVSMVATHLLTRSKSPTPPIVAVLRAFVAHLQHGAGLRGGRTNMTAGDVGMEGNQVRALKQLLAWTESPDVESATLIQRRLIGVGSPGHLPSCGFFVGGGAIYQGSLDTWNFRDQSKVPWMRTGLGTATSIVKLVTRHLWSRSAFEPTKARFTVNEQHGPEEDAWCVFMATTLDRIALGIYPFWGARSGPIRMMAVSHDHRKLLRAGVRAVWGKQSRHLKEANGYHGFSGHRITLELPSSGVTLDGEIIKPVNGTLRMGIAGELNFLRL